MQGFQPPELRLALLQRVHSCGQHCALPGDSQSHNKTNTGLEHQEAWAWKSFNMDSKTEFLEEESKWSLTLAEWPSHSQSRGFGLWGSRGGSTQGRGTTASLEGSLNLLCQEKSIHLIDLTSATASLGRGAAAGDAECWPTNAHISLLRGRASICTQNSLHGCMDQPKLSGTYSIRDDIAFAPTSSNSIEIG